MDSNSLDKTLKSILNTLPRTLAPLEAILKSKKLKKKLKKKVIFCQMKFFRTEHCDFTEKSNAVLKIAKRNNRDWKWTKILRTDSVENWKLKKHSNKNLFLKNMWPKRKFLSRCIGHGGSFPNQQMAQSWDKIF